VLSMDQGVSGECVRTRQPLRCDDVSQDPRVNQKACSKLGIASLVVTPIMNTDTVLGVFELFSGKPRSFNERDLSTLMRLSQLAETAVKHATAAHAIPQILEAAMQEMPAPVVKVLAATAPMGSAVVGDSPAASADQFTVKLPATKEESKAHPNPKTLLWSAALRIQPTAQEREENPPSVVRPDLANLRKCQACGFPVSQGRAFCVECEERQWRGQRLSQAAAAGSATPQKVIFAPFKPAGAAMPSAASSPDILTLSNTALPADLSGSHSSPFSGSTVKSRSWFAANKYILGALLVVAVVVAVIVWLR